MNEDTIKSNMQTQESNVSKVLFEEERKRKISRFEIENENQLLHRSTNIVQSICKKDFCDLNDYDSLLEEEILEAEYINKCTKNKVKPFQSQKLKYPNLYWLKIQERGIYSLEKRQSDIKYKEEQCREQKNEYLPKIKFDDSTTQVLNMLINNKYLGQFHDVVGTGSNSIVLHAYSSQNSCIAMPCNNAVKIYKTTKDKAKNQIIYKQVQREFEHLNVIYTTRKFRYRGIWAVKAIKNVIVMQFIGCDQPYIPAPNIAEMTDEHDHETYNAIIGYMNECYNLGNLVHGKLSAKKILCWWGDPKDPCFVGWSHSVKRNHPTALTKLMKDCQFVTEFYKRRGLAVKPTLELFKQITRQEAIEEELLKIIEDKNLYDKYDKNPNRRSIRPVSTKTITNKRFK